MSIGNLYEKLGIKSNATQDEIKKAYRELAMKHHPDRNNGKETAEFIEIKVAYEILSDPEARKVYESTGQAPPPADDTDIGAKAILGNLFIKVVELDENPDRIDIFSKMREVLENDIKRTHELIEQLTNSIGRLDRAKPCLQNLKQDSTLLEDVLDARKIIYADKSVLAQGDLKTLSRCFELLSGYKYNFQEIRQLGAPFFIPPHLFPGGQT